MTGISAAARRFQERLERINAAGETWYDSWRRMGSLTAAVLIVVANLVLEILWLVPRWVREQFMTPGGLILFLVSFVCVLCFASQIADFLQLRLSH